MHTLQLINYFAASDGELNPWRLNPQSLIVHALEARSETCRENKKTRAPACQAGNTGSSITEK